MLTVPYCVLTVELASVEVSSVQCGYCGTVKVDVLVVIVFLGTVDVFVIAVLFESPPRVPHPARTPAMLSTTPAVAHFLYLFIS